MTRYRHVSTYLALCRRAFATTATGRCVRLGWAGRDLDADDWRQEFRTALHRRISGRARNHRGEPLRKLAPIYQHGLERDARRIHDYVRHRIVNPINRLETPDLQRRFRWSYGPDGLDVILSRDAA